MDFEWLIERAPTKGKLTTEYAGDEEEIPADLREQ
jgi:hypothetical protein